MAHSMINTLGILRVGQLPAHVLPGSGTPLGQRLHPACPRCKARLASLRQVSPARRSSGRRRASRFLDLSPEGSPTQGVTSSRSEEHTSELQSLMRISYAVFCLKKKNNNI